GIQAMQPGNRLTVISHAIEVATAAAEDKWGVDLVIVGGFGGRGIGWSMLEDPCLPNEGKATRGPMIQEGSTLAKTLPITLGTEDGSWAAHWEHTVAATANGPRILTPRFS